MKRIRVKNSFNDRENENILRNVGEILEVEDKRAEDLISRGFCKLVEEIKKVEKAIDNVEVAVKEEKKEKAVREKAVRKNAKKQ